MKNLSVYLPPFAPDYSGVCSALFELDGMTVIHDAAGCTGNYTGFDEPRWYGSKKAVYCSALRKIDVVMGNEQKFVDRMVSAAQTVFPTFIAFVGSPVPMVIGTDFEGVCEDIKNATCLPTFGFATTGTKFYNDGIAQACISLLKYYAKPQPEKIPNRVNVLGATPLDFSQQNIDDIYKYLENNGFSIGAKFCMGLKQEQIVECAKSELNLAVSQSGVMIAQYMEKEFGIPYVVGVPIGRDGAKCLIEEMKCVLRGEKIKPIKNARGDKKALVIGDAIFAYSVSRALQAKGERYFVEAATPFTDAGNYYNVKTPEGELELLQLLEQESWDVLITDPLLKPYAPTAKKVLQIQHYAVSSKLGDSYEKEYIADKFDELINNLGEEKAAD